MAEIENLRQTQKWLERRKRELADERRQVQNQLARLKGDDHRMKVYRDTLMGRDDPEAVDGLRDQVRELENRLEDLDLYMRAADAEREENAARIHELKDEQPPKERRSPDRRKFDEVKEEIRRRLVENDGRSAGPHFNQLPDELLRAANGCGAQAEAKAFLEECGWRV